MTAEKDANAVDIIGRFGTPDAEWTADYPWTRYRGPQPWPCPGDWLLDEPEGTIIRWIRYPDVGEGHGTASVVDRKVLDHDGISDHRAEEAWLSCEDIADSMREETQKWTLEIKNTEVFSRVEPDFDELLGAVAEALGLFGVGGDWQAVDPTTGRLPPEQRRERTIERRKESNESLDAFGGDSE